MTCRIHPDALVRRSVAGRSARGAAAMAIVAALGASLLAGCSSTRVDAPAPVEDRLSSAAARAQAAGSAASSAGVGDRGSGVSETQVASVDLASQGAGQDGSRGLDAVPASQRVIYFDFDSFVVKEDFRSVVEFGARYLQADRQRRLLVEGHTDERGGREYNLALGQKRADAVVRAMQLLGAQEAQMEAVSYGEERPAAPGSDEAAWAKNRRAELKDR